MVVLVTNKNYVLAERVDEIYITEEEKSNNSIFKTPSRRRKGKKAVHAGPDILYRININYVPIGQSNPNRNGDSGSVCTISTFDKKVAERIFAEMVKQIREQCPDQVYLDKIIEKELLGMSHD